MLQLPRHQCRWLTVFGLGFGALVGIALWSSLGLESFRDRPFDFHTMRPNELFVVRGLTRRQEGSVKVGFAEAYAPPQIGLYGNHVFQHFGAEAFGPSGDASYFFNFWYANLALPEIYRYLRHVERLGQLPKKLILIQITSPNLDNGLFIINYGHELLPDLLLSGAEGEGPAERTLHYTYLGWQLLGNVLHETLNYNTLILGLTRSGTSNRLVDPTACDPDSVTSGRAWLRHLPGGLQSIVEGAKPRSYCQVRFWRGAFRRDGSTDARYESYALIQDEDPLRDTERGINAGDEQAIARQMQAIDALGRRNAVKVAFVVPPAYETDRRNSVVNQVFDRALALVPDLTVVDDRDMRTDPALFMDYRHPSPKYFRALVDELRRCALLD